jgi:GNAT superfamily N-acetyltransferase
MRYRSRSRMLTGCVTDPIEMRQATDDDAAFVIEMARMACSIEDRPLPPADSAEVVSMLPGDNDSTLVAVDHAGRQLGAAWWCFHDPPLLADADGRPIPEIAMAVVEVARGQGIGTALIEALAQQAAARFDALALNVHIRNPAARLYTRTGFHVAAAGRGPFGVAMLRTL